MGILRHLKAWLRRGRLDDELREELAPEIGVRMALGAPRGAVRWMVLRESLVLVGVGLAAGIPAALAGTRLLDSFLFELPPRDPLTLAGASILSRRAGPHRGVHPGATRIPRGSVDCLAGGVTMPKVANVFRRLRSMVSARQLDADLRDEMAAHIEARRRALVDDGVDPAEAAAQARRQFGNVAAISERARDARGFPAVESFVQDLRYGARLLLRAPLFTRSPCCRSRSGSAAVWSSSRSTNALVLRPIANGGEEIYKVYTAAARGRASAGLRIRTFLDFARARRLHRVVRDGIGPSEHDGRDGGGGAGSVAW